MVGDLELAIEKEYRKAWGSERSMLRNLSSILNKRGIRTFDDFYKKFPYPVDLINVKGVGYKTYYVMMDILKKEGKYEPARREATINY